MLSVSSLSFFACRKIPEQFFCCNELRKTTTGQNDFDTLDSIENLWVYLVNHVYTPKCAYKHSNHTVEVQLVEVLPVGFQIA